MDLRELIDKAVEAKGSRRNVAEGLHQNPQRLTDWKAGTRKPDAHEIAYLAECAGLPVLETVAEIESQLDARYASIWRRALGKLKAAGVAASVLAALILAPLTLTTQDAKAAASQIETVPFRQR
ncbi:MAG TPA: transcriptional regulator [Burkholderiaceae bacterium]|nr:transcriptional regulator [Burkholderiaceae bacterium]